jgi:hypothetical protein
MGIRGELFSTRVSCNGRTYFFNVKENRMGDMFLTVVESKPTETEGFERRSVVVFREDMEEFVKAFQGALSFMEKPGKAAKGLGYSPEDKGGDRRPKTPGGFAGKQGPGGESAEAAPKKRRIVVRKKPADPKGDGEGHGE